MKRLILVYGILSLITTSCIQKNKQSLFKVENQWAIYNNAQMVNNKKGKKGIDVNLFNTWGLTKGRKEVIVAILDTGINISDSNIKEVVYKNKNGYVDDLSGWDFYHNNNTVYDNYIADAHGTYIANIIAGSHSKKEYYGVAPGVTIMPLKILHGNDGSIKDIPKAIDYAYKQGARIFNCSLDYENFNKHIYDRMKKYSDAVFICAGGKKGTNLDKNPIYPSGYTLKNIVSVGAVDNRGEIYSASGYGKTIDIFAPGENVEVNIGNDQNIYVDGTSASAAYVTGAFALLKSLDSDLSLLEIKNVIINKSRILSCRTPTGENIKLLDIDAASKQIYKGDKK